MSPLPPAQSRDNADIKLNVGPKSTLDDEIEVNHGLEGGQRLPQLALRSPRQRNGRERSLSSANRPVSINLNHESPPVRLAVTVLQQEKTIVGKDGRAVRRTNHVYPPVLPSAPRFGPFWAPKIPARERLQRSILERNAPHSPSNSIPTIRKPSISTKEDAAASGPQRRGSMASLRSISSATLPEMADDSFSKDVAPRRRESMVSLRSVPSTGTRPPERADDSIFTRDAAPPKPSGPRRRGSVANMQPMGSATGIRPPKRADNPTPEGGIERGRFQAKETGSPWTSMEKGSGEESGIRRSGSPFYAAANKFDEKHASLVSTSRMGTLAMPSTTSLSTVRAIISTPDGRERKEEDAEGRSPKGTKQRLDDERVWPEKVEKERLRVEAASTAERKRQHRLEEKGRRRDARPQWEQTQVQSDDIRIGEAQRRPNETAEQAENVFLEERLDHRRKSIEEHLCKLDKMDLSKSRIWLLETVHQEMWSDLLTLGCITWNDLPWPAFVRPTCPEDLILHRTVSYFFQASKTMDIKEVLNNPERVQWAQQRLQMFLGNWGRINSRRKLLENSADFKNIIEGVHIVTKHLEGLLPVLTAPRIDESHHKALTTMISRTFLEQIGENLAQILNDITDNSSYRSLLRLEGNSAQKMINFLHALLDCRGFVSLPKNHVLGALLRLSRLSKLYPECLTLMDVERDNIVMATSGRFGEICKGRSRNQDICLKIIKINQQSQIGHLLKAFAKEALLWGHLSHPNVLPFYGIYHLEDMHGRICLVSPWMENGNVTEYLKGHPMANRLLLVWDIIKGIQFLHENKVVHGDLKGLNVLVNHSGRGCLADFGLANLADEDILRWTSVQSTVHQTCGTLRWQAPELIDPPPEELGKTTQASDIYAFACVFYEIYTGQIPFYEIPRNFTVMKKVIEGYQPPRPVDTTLLSDEIWELIEMCWDQVPQHRPSAEIVIDRLPLAGVVDDRPSGDDFLAPSDFRENSGMMFDPAVDTVLSSLLRSTQTREADELQYKL